MLLVSPSIFGMIYCTIATYGSVKMQTLESRVWGMVSAVMILLPFTAVGIFAVLCIIFTFVFYLLMDVETMFWVLPLWILIAFGGNLAVGIWALVTLNRQDVIDGYEYVPD